MSSMGVADEAPVADAEPSSHSRLSTRGLRAAGEEHEKYGAHVEHTEPPRVVLFGALPTELRERVSAAGWRVKRCVELGRLLCVAERSQLAMLALTGSEESATRDAVAMLRVACHATKVLLVVDDGQLAPNGFQDACRSGAHLVFPRSASADAILRGARALLFDGVARTVGYERSRQYEHGGFPRAKGEPSASATVIERNPAAAAPDTSALPKSPESKSRGTTDTLVPISGVRAALADSIPSIAGMTVAVSGPPRLRGQVRDWALGEGCFVLDCPSEKHLLGSFAHGRIDLVVVHPLEADPQATLATLGALRARDYWGAALYLGSSELPAELRLAIEAGATSALPRSELPTLLRSARLLLCASARRYHRILRAKRIIVKNDAVFVDGRERPVPARELILLVFLMQRAGRPVTAIEIAEAAFPGAVAPPTARKWIQFLREVLGDDSGNILRTVRGEGYQIDR